VKANTNFKKVLCRQHSGVVEAKIANNSVTLGVITGGENKVLGDDALIKDFFSVLSPTDIKLLLYTRFRFRY